MSRKLLLGLGAALLVLWAISWLLLRVASVAIHVLLGLGLVLLVIGLVRRVATGVRSG